MAVHSSHGQSCQMSLEMFPDDIIEQILLFVSPLDNLSTLQSASRRLRRLASRPLLWRHHCVATFRYWEPYHGMEGLLKMRASSTDWKGLFLTRQRKNASIARTLDRIVATKVGRIDGMRQICRYGYDAKDFLIEKCRTVCDDPNVLAIRYFAGAILGSIHRNIAIQQWLQVCNSNPSDPFYIRPSLEKSLAAFDMFVLHDQRGDIEETSELLQSYATQFMRFYPQWKERSTRQTALALNEWIRASSLTGLQNQQLDYRNLRNCFIGQALRDPRHESIPIISSAIYCCIAERIGLQADCFLAPICVHVVITAPAGYDLDNNRSEEEHKMYLDPFGTDGEVPLDRLEHLVSHADMSVASLRNSGTVLAITTRTAHNIEASHTAGSRRSDPLSLSRLLHGHAAMNRQLALYATRWALLALQMPFTRLWAERQTQLLKQILRDWPEDEWIMSDYVIAQGHRTGSDVAMQHMDLFVMNRARHPEQPQPDSFQNQLTAARVAPFQLGQVFMHRRYGWLGAVVGFYEVPPASWGVFDAATEGDSSVQSNDNRRRFYIKTISASNTEERVVAPGNLQLVNDESQVTGRMFPLSGKYFKRFDRENCRFISNVDEDYPRLTIGG